MLGHLVVKYKRRSIHGHMEEKTCPLTLCSLFPLPSLPAVPAVNCRIPLLDCILLQLAWLCWIMKQILLKCQFIGICVVIKEESVQIEQQGFQRFLRQIKFFIFGTIMESRTGSLFIPVYTVTHYHFFSLSRICFLLCLDDLILAFLSKFLFYMLIPWLGLIPVKIRSFYRYCWCSPCIFSYFIAACSLSAQWKIELYTARYCD